MSKLYNLARMTTATTGTGTITLGSAVAGFLTFASAGVEDGDTVTYALRDGANSEIGRGVYSSSGTTLTRSVMKSTNSDSPISLSGAAEVFITVAAEDFPPGRTLLRVISYTSNGTWTPLPDTTMVCLATQGAGGGGGGSTTTGSGASSAAGGGGGGYQERWLSAGWGASETVTVGTGGAGGVGGNNGQTGGTTSIGTLCVATGGEGGTWSARTTSNLRGNTPPGAGGTGTGTGGVVAGLEYVRPGNPGGIGVRFGPETQSFSGVGGDSAMGAGGVSTTETQLNGSNGTGYGGGGSGAATGSASGGTGGNGAPGIAIISEWA